MKKILILSAILLSFVACDKLSEYTKFDLKYNTSVTIPSTFGMNIPFTVYTPSVTTNTESQFSLNNTRTDLIEEVTLKSVILTITDPEGSDFSFLKSIEVYLSADSLDEIKIASREGITNDVGDTLHLVTEPDDLQAYIKKESFTLSVKTVTDEMLSHDYTIDIDAVFGVDARILGL